MAKRILTLKLLVDEANQRVLFAEAGKEVVDFLFSLLALPVGTVARLLAAKGMVGSVGNLYGSLKRLDDTYVVAGFNKEVLLNPTTSFNTSGQSAFLLNSQQYSSLPANDKLYYRCDGSTYYDEKGYSRQCSKWGAYVTDGVGVPCPCCKRPMMTQLTYLPHRTSNDQVTAAKDGYVKGVVIYMVMDDLAVQPMSNVSSIALLSKLHIRDLSSLEERTVHLGIEEGLLLLKAAFCSETVLSDVFLKRTVT